MILTPGHTRVLRQAAIGAVTAHSFARGSTFEAAPAMVERWLSELQQAGYLARNANGMLAITRSGRYALDRIDQQSDAPKDFLSRGIYKGEKWNIRSGGEAHKQFGSLMFSRRPA